LHVSTKKHGYCSRSRKWIQAKTRYSSLQNNYTDFAVIITEVEIVGLEEVQ
jgi:hypothetical protein